MILLNTELSGQRAKRSLLNQTIYFSGDGNLPAIQDLVFAMEQYTGKSIDIKPEANTTNGIHIIPQPLGIKDGQQFDIAMAPEKCTIWYSDYLGVNHSLSNAVYYLLSQLGMEWLSSGPDGLEVPRIVTVPTIAKTTITYAIKDRIEFGTGGNFARIKLSNGQDAPIEFNNGKSYSDIWAAFNRRIGFGQDFRSSGHMGDLFYLQNKTLCDSHPEWFNSESGKLGGRIKIEIPDALDAWVTWARGLVPTGVKFRMVPTDPEDGRGGVSDPLPPNGFSGINNWGASDKWFYVANKVAEGFDENDPYTKISISAYGDGPDNVKPPQFKIRKNVNVLLNAWAFQTRYPVREDMFKDWKDKIQDYASAYDYWNITQWSLGLPQMENILNNNVYKLGIYLSSKVRGITLETTDSNLMAPIFYTAMKVWRDPYQNSHDIFREWFKQYFGNAWSPMFRMYDRWINRYYGIADIGMSLEDIDEARVLVAKNSKYWRRVMTYAAYIHYTLLYQKNSDKSICYSWLYKIHHLQMVQTPAFIGQRYFGEPPAADGITHATWDEIEAQFETDLAANPKIFEPVPFSLNPRKASFIERHDSWYFITGITPMATVHPGGSVLNFDVGIYNVEWVNESRLIVINSDGNTLIDTTIVKTDYDYTFELGDKQFLYKRFSIETQPGKSYTIAGPGSVKMISPELMWVNNVKNDFDGYLYPVKYIWVPNNATEIIFKNDAFNGQSAKVWDSSYTGVITLLQEGATPAQNIYRVAVPIEHRGKCWGLSYGSGDNEILNLPNICSLQPFNYSI